MEEVKLFVKGIDVPAPHWVTTLDREEISMELISFMQVQLASEQSKPSGLETASEFKILFGPQPL